MLCERGVPSTPVDHSISKALYFSNPAGNGLEAYVDRRAERDLSSWDGENRRFDPAALYPPRNRWRTSSSLSSSRPGPS